MAHSEVELPEAAGWRPSAVREGVRVLGVPLHNALTLAAFGVDGLDAPEVPIPRDSNGVLHGNCVEQHPILLVQHPRLVEEAVCREEQAAVGAACVPVVAVHRQCRHALEQHRLAAGWVNRRGVALVDVDSAVPPRPHPVAAVEMITLDVPGRATPDVPRAHHLAGGRKAVLAEPARGRHVEAHHKAPRGLAKVPLALADAAVHAFGGADARVTKVRGLAVVRRAWERLKGVGVAEVDPPVRVVEVKHLEAGASLVVPEREDSHVAGRDDLLDPVERPHDVRADHRP